MFFIDKIIHFMPDNIYVCLQYYYHFRKFPNLVNPKLFNEKLQWLKLHERNPIHTRMVDKYLAKAFVAEVLGEGHTIPTLGVWENAKDIDLSILPDQFVLKCNHDSHSIKICRDKSTFDFNRVKVDLNKRLKRNGFWYGREWPYKNVKALIIAEPYMSDSKQSEGLFDYKFFCFDGQPKIMYISNDKSKNPHTDFFDMNFRRLNIRMKDPNSAEPPPKPPEFEEMKAMAAKLSRGCKHLRVDFYVVNSTIYVGELTFFHNSGYCRISPDEWNVKLGNWIEL